MRILGRVIGLLSAVILMFFGSALDSPTMVPVFGCLAGLAGLGVTAVIAALLV